MTQQEEKDFFISYDKHNKTDRQWAAWIASLLEDNKYSCILQDWDFLPGSNFWLEIDKALLRAKRVLAVLSPDYLNAVDTHPQWAGTFAQDPAGEKRKLIPVRVQDCKPKGLLASIIPIDLVDQSEDVAFTRLLQGVGDTRLKPDQLPKFPGTAVEFPGPSRILIASLGESPVVVTAMDDLLRAQGLDVNRVRILHPDARDVNLAYNLIKEFLPDKHRLRSELLPFSDADSWLNACLFLKRLCDVLEQCQEKGDTVYLSLAGGRKSMGALMAWVVPYFSCIEKLYHVIDKDEDRDSFLSVHEIEAKSEAKRSHLMHPDTNRLKLVPIPFERAKQEDQKKMSEELQTKLLSSLPDDYDRAEARITEQAILLKDKLLQVQVTARVVKQFNELYSNNIKNAQIVRNGLLELSLPFTLREREPDFDTMTFKAPKFPQVLLRYFTGLSVPIHPVFYTLPEDIYTNPDDPVERVVVCSLETVHERGFKTLTEVAEDLDPSIRERHNVDVLQTAPSPAKSVLIVPLGKSPMVATQLYTLLKERVQREICEVVLICPRGSATVMNAARLVQKALCEKANEEDNEEDNIECSIIGPTLSDITSEDDCRKYQDYLENEIARIRHEYQDYKIDLALSGGRKGMTAMTIFAAQKNHIPYVYHTLITDEKLNYKIEEETTVQKLNSPHLSRKECHDRLFLRAYTVEGPDPYANFVLFRVPVFTAEGW